VDKWRKEAIDHALSERDFAYLADLIRGPDLDPDARDYLATIVLGLLTGKIKRPKHRPKKKSTKWEARHIARDVMGLHRYRPEWAKVTAAVVKVAKDRGCAVSTVWKAWSEHQLEALLFYEQHEYDAMLDIAHEDEWKSAVESLKEQHGDREFTDEEVHDEIDEQRMAYQDFDRDD
jgi:hypothetical protein